jgi:hypothetical protein
MTRQVVIKEKHSNRERLPSSTKNIVKWGGMLLELLNIFKSLITAWMRTSERLIVQIPKVGGIFMYTAEMALRLGAGTQTAQRHPVCNDLDSTRMGLISIFSCASRSRSWNVNCTFSPSLTLNSSEAHKPSSCCSIRTVSTFSKNSWSFPVPVNSVAIAKVSWSTCTTLMRKAFYWP